MPNGEAHVRIDEVEIYGLYDPDTKELRYIGKAKNSAQRLKTHLWDSRTADRPVCRWIKALILKGKTPRLEVLQTVPQAQWQAAEIALIAAHRNTSKLLNLAPGGDKPYCSLENRVKAAKASNQEQAKNPKMALFNRAKLEMGKLYKASLNKPDIHCYTLRLLMKCYAAWRPDLHKSWVNLP